MKFEEIKNLSEYEEFVKNSDNAHFMQSRYCGDVMKYKNFPLSYPRKLEDISLPCNRNDGILHIWTSFRDHSRIWHLLHFC